MRKERKELDSDEGQEREGRTYHVHHDGLVLHG